MADFFAGYEHLAGHAGATGTRMLLKLPLSALLVVVTARSSPQSAQLARLLADSL